MCVRPSVHLSIRPSPLLAKAPPEAGSGLRGAISELPWSSSGISMAISGLTGAGSGFSEAGLGHSGLSKPGSGLAMLA